MSAINVFIVTGVKEKDGVNYYVEVKIKPITGPSRKRECAKQFKDFAAFNTELGGGGHKLPPFPPNKWFGASSPGVIDERKRSLQTYFQKLLSNSDASIERAIVSFFECEDLYEAAPVKDKEDFEKDDDYFEKPLSKKAKRNLAKGKETQAMAHELMGDASRGRGKSEVADKKEMEQPSTSGEALEPAPSTSPEPVATQPESEPEAKPETTQPESEPETTQPEAETTQPEAETTQPEAETTQREAETTQPEAETTHPEATQPQSEPEADNEVRAAVDVRAETEAKAAEAEVRGTPDDDDDDDLL